MEKIGLGGDKVVVTGVTGFLGSWLTYMLIENGSYSVRATMRNSKDQSKLDKIKGGFKEKFDKLELVEADMSDDASIDKAIEGCKYVFHVATPFPAESPSDENELIKPAVNGAESIVKACDKHGVKRLVFTSTIGTMDDWTLGDCEINEECQAPIDDDTIPYVKSKILAENKIQEMVTEINETRKKESKPELELVIINPSFIQGPLIIECSGASQQLVSGIMTGKIPQVPPYHLKGIDVRDLALAHIKGLEIEPYKRYAMIAGESTFAGYGEWIKERYGKYGYDVTTKEVGTFLLWVGSFFNKDAKFLYSLANVKLYYNTDMTKEAMGFEYRDIKESLYEQCESLIKFGIVEDKTKEKVAE
jgi:dihydroflavonol-4-reductase